jgi:hypothetical protein
MWGFVRKILSEGPKFNEERRQARERLLCLPKTIASHVLGPYCPQRCSPFEADPQAYGSGHKPNPPMPNYPISPASQSSSQHPALGCHKGSMRRMATTTSALSSMASCGSMDLQEAQGEQQQLQRSSTGGLVQTRTGRMRGLAAFAIATGLALLLHKSASSDRLPGMVGSRRVRRMGRSARGTSLRRAHTQQLFADLDHSITTEVEGL